MDQDNDNLGRQLKKMSVKCTLKEMEEDVKSRSSSSSSSTHSDTDMDLKIQLDLAEKELSTLVNNMKDLDEENELMRKEIYMLETKVKDQEKLLKVIPEPSSPSVYYEEKMREMTKESDDLKSKLLDKENELELLYAQVQALRSAGSCKSYRKDLRKSKSLESELEMDFNVMVDLKRQLEISKQEILTLKEKLKKLEEVNMKEENEPTKKVVDDTSGASRVRYEISIDNSDVSFRKSEVDFEEADVSTDDSGMNIDKFQAEYDELANDKTNATKIKCRVCDIGNEVSKGLTEGSLGSDEMADLRTQLDLMQVSKRLLEKNIEHLLRSIISYSRSTIPEIYKKHILNITNSSNPAHSPLLIESSGTHCADEKVNVNATSPREPGNSCQPGVLKSSSEFPGICIPTPSNAADDTTDQTNGLSRDPDTVLFIIEQAFCELAKLLCEMDTENRKEVVPECGGVSGSSSEVSPEMDVRSDMSSSMDSQAWETVSESSDNTEDYHSVKSELSTPTNEDVSTPTNRNLNQDLTSPRHSQFIEESLAFLGNSKDQLIEMDLENNPCETQESSSPLEKSESENVTSASEHSDVTKADVTETSSVHMLQMKIEFLDEEIGKFNLINTYFISILKSRHIVN